MLDPTEHNQRDPTASLSVSKPKCRVSGGGSNDERPKVNKKGNEMALCMVQREAEVVDNNNRLAGQSRDYTKAQGRRVERQH
jgi:hypothetical protein